ncbi:MAG: hypothetical protein AAB790_00640 [Patescibacteria group bacterium]
MATPHGRLLNRGATILSALVFVALLAGVATTVQYFSPYANVESQTAEAAAPAAAAPAKKPGATLKGASRCNAPIEVKKDKNAKGPLDGEKGVESVCVKGCQYKIYPGTPTTIDAIDTCKDITDAASKKKCETEKQCVVSQCGAAAGSCQAVGGGSEKKKDEILGKAALVPEYFKNDPAIQKLLEDAKTDPTGVQARLSKLDPYMQAAFSEAKDDEQTKMQNKQADNYAAIQALGQNDPEAKRLAEENKRLAEQNANLSKIDTRKLAEEQTPVVPPKTPEDKAPTYQGPCQYGQMDSKTGACPPKPGCTGPNCSRDGSGTFDPNAGKNTGGNSNPMSAFGSMLQGLMKALGAPQPPPSAPAQACATDRDAYAQQQAQYQQQLQQYNYQLQQYQYQQQMNQYYAQQNGGIAPPTQPPPAQPTPCTPSTGNQCQSQPQQPPPSACSAGAWRATYSGACITGWQCISTEGPKAELVCEPDLADVGQTLALTYNCSSGIASSSAFKVTTQPGGSATTTVKAPPQGTNTATYTLACTDNGKTTGAQCSVKVNRPNIFLVTNPRTLAPGEISLISWLTTGMDSCIISSPDQPDFTLRNSSNTSVTGAATTSPITSSAMFQLDCITKGGIDRQATTTVEVGD